MPIDPFNARNQPRAEAIQQNSPCFWYGPTGSASQRCGSPGHGPGGSLAVRPPAGPLPHCSEIEALKLELATDMDHVSPEVRNLLGLATIDLMASANQVAASVADAVLGHEVTESASGD